MTEKGFSYVAAIALTLSLAVLSFVILPKYSRADSSGTYTTSRDAWIDQNKPDDNYGDKKELKILSKPDKNQRTVVAFNFDEIPADAIINSALLQLFASKVPHVPHDYGVYRITTDWAEDTVTWDEINTFYITMPTATTSTGESDGILLSWDVKTDVQNFVSDPSTFPNYGWMIRDTEEGINPQSESKFKSREDGADGPKLIISYTVPPPTITPAIDPVPNAAGWNNSDVTVTWDVSGGDISSTSGCNATSTADETDSWVLTCEATNPGGTASSSVTVKLDKTPPQITLNSPVDGAEYELGRSVLADWSATDTLSGIDSASGTTASGEPVDTASEGIKEFSVSARDAAGNVASTTISYNVIVPDEATPIPTSTPPPSPSPSPLPAAAEIFSEQEGAVFTRSVEITWETDHPATSRVIYDTLSHSVLGDAPNYGYANSTVEDPSLYLYHVVRLTGLKPGTTYYARPISHGSPESVGEEMQLATSGTSHSGGGFVNVTTTPSPEITPEVSPSPVAEIAVIPQTVVENVSIPTPTAGIVPAVSPVITAAGLSPAEIASAVQSGPNMLLADVISIVMKVGWWWTVLLAAEISTLAAVRQKRLKGGK